LPQDVTPTVAVAVPAARQRDNLEDGIDFEGGRPGNRAIGDGIRAGRWIVGTEKADRLIGTTADDLIVGKGGADRITGRAGADIFQYTSLSESLLSAHDHITDLEIGIDYIVAPKAVPSGNVRQLGRVSQLRRSGVGQLLTSASFPANHAATFSLVSGRRIRTFLALNDGVPGFNARRDGLIEITGFKGYLRDLMIAGPGMMLPVINLSVSPASVMEDGLAGLVYTFSRTGEITKPLVVGFTVSGSATLGSDYVGISPEGTVKTIDFRAGEATARLVVQPVADRIVEDDETVVLTLAAGSDYSVGTPWGVTGRILNDDILSVDRNLFFSVLIKDEQGKYALYRPLIRSSILAAGAYWDYYLGGHDVNLDVVVRIDDAIDRATGRSKASSFIRNNGVYDVYEQGAAAEIRTGVDPNGDEPDIEIVLNPDYLLNELWFDSDPLLRLAPVPPDRTDAVSVFMHELGHAFAFNGWMDGLTGAMPADYQSVFDELIHVQEGNFYFMGEKAVEVYGSPVPLSYGNISHVGNLPPRPGSDLIPDLMNGIVFYRGSRYYISPLDRAMMADLGLPVAA
jgi:hypothetical protein